MEMTFEEAIKRVYNYVENQHHEYCWNDVECNMCRAIVTLKEMFPITLDNEAESGSIVVRGQKIWPKI